MNRSPTAVTAHRPMDLRKARDDPATGSTTRYAKAALVNPHPGRYA